MAEAESQTDDEQNSDEESFSYYPQVTQHATTVVEGDIVDIVTGADIDGGVEQTGSSFGVVFENPTVAGDTSVWKNRDIPDGFSTVSEFNDTIKLAAADEDDYIRGTEATEANIQAARERLVDGGFIPDTDAEIDVSYSPQDGMTATVDGEDIAAGGTDYKIADTSDSRTEEQEVGGEILGVDVGGGTYGAEKLDDFDADRIMVWYGGMAGQFIGRGLDFNGQPFSRWTDEGYLIKGLFQVPIGWRGDADLEQYDDVPTTDHKELATDLGRKPRVVRPPILREDIDGRVFVAIGRYNGGRMNEVHIGRAMDSYDDMFESLRANDEPEYDSFDMKYDAEADERIATAFDNPAELLALYTGEGWASEPANAQSFGESDGDSDGGSFDIETDDSGVEHPTDEEDTFAQMVSEKLAGTGVENVDDAFDDGLEGLVESNADNFDNEYDVGAIRELVEEYTDGL